MSSTSTSTDPAASTSASASGSDSAVTSSVDRPAPAAAAAAIHDDSQRHPTTSTSITPPTHRTTPTYPPLPTQSPAPGDDPTILVLTPEQRPTDVGPGASGLETLPPSRTRSPTPPTTSTPPAPLRSDSTSQANSATGTSTAPAAAAAAAGVGSGGGYPEREGGSGSGEGEIKSGSLVTAALQNPFLLFVTAYSSIGGLLFGYDIGVIGGVTVFDGFRDYFAMPRVVSGQSDNQSTAFLIGWIVASLTLGAAAAALVAGAIADKWGRRFAISFGAAIFTVAGIIQAAAVDLAMLFIGRILAGVAIGILSFIVPLYNSEISPKHLRGALGTLQQLSITFGILVAFALNIAFQTIGSDGWRYSLGIQSVFSLFLFLGTLFLPESPRWYMLQHRPMEARQVLNKIRKEERVDPKKAAEEARKAALEAVGAERARVGDVTAQIDESKFQTNIDEELEEMRLSVEVQERIGEGKWSDLIARELRIRTTVGCGIQTFQQLTGVNAVMYYAPTIFTHLNFSGLIGTAIMGIVNFVSTILTTSLVDKLGRVPLLTAGTWGMFATSLVIGILSVGAGTAGGAGVAIIVLVCLFIANFAYSWGPIGWIIPAEIYPLSVRAKAISVTTCTNWLFNFAIGLATPPLLSAAGTAAFFLFSFFLACMGIFIFFFLPETRQVSLERMDVLFGVTNRQQLREYFKSNAAHSLQIMTCGWRGQTTRAQRTNAHALEHASTQQTSKAAAGMSDVEAVQLAKAMVMNKSAAGDNSPSREKAFASGDGSNRMEKDTQLANGFNKSGHNMV